MTTVTFSRILQTGMSFLGVTIAITVIFAFFNSIGTLLVYSSSDTDNAGLLLVGSLFIILAFLVFIAGSIGIFQKLVSDAFLEGFITARDSENPINEKKMGVFETLKSGFQVIGIIVLTSVISGFILGLGFVMQYLLEGDFGFFIASLLYGVSCALVLAISIGMFTMILAEGVFTGAKNSGITFVNSAESSTVKSNMADTMILAEGVFTGAKNSGITFVNSAESSTEKSNMADENIQPPDTEEENYPEENSPTDEEFYE